MGWAKGEINLWSIRILGSSSKDVDAMDFASIGEVFGSISVVVEAVEFVIGLLLDSLLLCLLLLTGLLGFSLSPFFLVNSNLCSNLFHLLLFLFGLKHSWCDADVIIVEKDVANTVICTFDFGAVWELSYTVGFVIEAVELVQLMEILNVLTFMGKSCIFSPDSLVFVRFNIGHLDFSHVLLLLIHGLER